MINIMVPVLVAILLFSYISYQYSKSELEEYYRQEREVIVDEVKSLLSFYDFAMRAHELNYSDRMKMLSSELVNRYFILSNRLDTFDLFRISNELKIDTTSEFIYIIDSSGKIPNTTFLKDLNLDFGKLDTAYLGFFNRVWKDTGFVEDRFGHEIKTNKIKKYSYQSAKNGKYIIELGFYSNTAIALKDLLEQKVKSISDKFSEMLELKLIVGVENHHHEEVREDHFELYNKCIKNKSSERIIESTDSGKITYDYIFLEIAEASMYSGYVINIISDDSKEKALFWNELVKFSIIFILITGPLFLLILLRARQLTRPIKNLTKKAEMISKGNLKLRVDVEGRNEISELSENFNLMVEQLEDSYNTLEHRVEERTKELSEQKELVEEKNKEILDSIHYAKRIQEAILPPEKHVKKYLPESFILFKPKDIVAGDFYWLESFAKASDSKGLELPLESVALAKDFEYTNLVFLAACDCTGHGVPGAMVSVVANNALNRAVREFKLKMPNEILDKVNDLVEETFSKSESDVKDGMDVSLCAIDVKKRILFWSGANNPLWIVKNSNEIIEVKADKQPIGKHDNRKPFTLHSFQLEKNDLIYIFSDGYADQFGGVNGKKFKYAQFKSLVLSIATKPLAEQSNIILKEFEKWRGDLEQVDDVCIIAVRL